MKNLDGLFSKNKNNNFISFKYDDSSEEENIIFPFINNDSIIKNNNNIINIKLKDNENTKKPKVEKGIFISPLCYLSKNKNYFGSKIIKNKLDINKKNKTLTLSNNHIKKIKCKNSRNNIINSLNRLISNNTHIPDLNIFENNKNNKNNKKNVYLNKITDYKSRNKNLNIENNNNNILQKKKQFFTNETLSSCCKDLFDKKNDAINSKKNSLSKNNKNNKNFKNNQYIHNYKTLNNKSLSNSNKKRDYFYKRRRKYIFKCNPYMIINKFIDLSEKLKLLNKNNLNSLKKEVNKYFGSNFSIIQKEKFPYKFRNPLLNNNYINDNNLEKNEKNKEINENILPGISIIKEINDKQNIEKENIDSKKKINKKRLIYKFKSSIIKNSNYIKHISVPPREMLIINKDNKENNENIDYYINKNKKTMELIQAIKAKNLELVNDLVEKNMECVADCDIFKFTPLHWAAKKDFYSIIPKLISYGAQVNCQNFLGETPLHISVKKNYYETTVLLLIFLASPFIKNCKGKKPFDYSKDYQMNIIYKKITNLHYKNMFVQNKLFYDNIQNELMRFILDEFSTQIKKDCLIIVEDIEREKKNRADLELKFKNREI